MTNRAYRFRLYPNAEQQQFLAKTFGCVRFVYNRMLADNEETGKTLQVTPARYKKEFPWLLWTMMSLHNLQKLPPLDNSSGGSSFFRIAS